MGTEWELESLGLQSIMGRDAIDFAVIGTYEEGGSR